MLQLQAVSYRLNGDPGDKTSALGFVAQEVEPLFPEVVGEARGFKSIAYTELVPVTVAAIQELNRKLEDSLTRRDASSRARDAELERLKEQNTALEERLERLERRLGAR